MPSCAARSTTPPPTHFWRRPTFQFGAFLPEIVLSVCLQQLKEVLAKQMELGFEAAEVPSSYLLDLEKEPPLEGRSTNKRGKRGRGSDKWQSKKQRARNGPPPLPPPAEPTLLQKLLSSEIKRDRSRLLQAFRFMTLNAFFDNWPGKPLEYPLVTVGDGGGIEGSGAERTQPAAAVAAEGAAAAECSEESDCVTDGGAMEEEEEGAAGGSEEQGCSGEQTDGATELKG